ncbi:MAG: SOS response-associated peptidase [Patescibacteria group bacterium]|nr:SOS response-associated peptidase [Patescibacteria group bacterium]
MCGRFDIQLPTESLGKIYQADIANIEDFTPRYNIAPAQFAPVLFGDTKREFDFARFGMHPDWFKFKSRDLTNLWKETLLDKPFFRHRLEQNRCILPVSGFYEWKRSGGRKTPFRFRPAEDEVFSLACIWEIGTFRGQKSPSFAIITGPSNGIMKPVHDRMPVILKDEFVGGWLDPETEMDNLIDMMGRYSDSGMESYRVSTRVNNPRNDDASLIEPT